MLIRITSAYGTISEKVAQVVAKIGPIDLLAKYMEKKESKDSGLLSVNSLQTILEILWWKVKKNRDFIHFLVKKVMKTNKDKERHDNR